MDASRNTAPRYRPKRENRLPLPANEGSFAKQTRKLLKIIVTASPILTPTDLTVFARGSNLNRSGGWTGRVRKPFTADQTTRISL
jgi:hypothetical protein